MTQQYKYNTATKQFVEDEGNLGISFYQAPWVEATQEQAKSHELQEAKDSKIAQMKINRDANIAKDYVLSEGNEITTTVVEPIQSDWVIGDIYTFYFNVKETGLSATEPSTVLTNATNTDFVPYSCGIIDPNSESENEIRQGYIRITAAIADAIGNDLKNRTVFSVIRANTLEIQIKDCNTIEEVNAIDINFNDIN